MIASVPQADPPDLGPRIVRLFRPHRRVLALIVAMIVVTSVLSVISALLVRRVFDHALFVRGGPDLGALYPLVAALIAIPIVNGAPSSTSAARGRFLAELELRRGHREPDATLTAAMRRPADTLTRRAAADAAARTGVASPRLLHHGASGSQMKEATTRRALALCVVVVALAVPGSASAATTRQSFDVTGAVFPCPTHTFTVTSGAITSVMHETVDVAGTSHFTVTETPDRVSLVDENGNTYSLRGAIWFGGRNDEVLTATHMLNIVGRGGVSDTIRLVEQFRNGRLISRDFGSCELP